MGMGHADAFYAPVAPLQSGLQGTASTTRIMVLRKLAVALETAKHTHAKTRSQNKNTHTGSYENRSKNTHRRQSTATTRESGLDACPTQLRP